MTHGTRARPGEAAPTFERLLSIETDDCVLWPFARLVAGGYGGLNVHKRMTRVHVLACERHHGPKPPGMEVAHSCGVPACMNYRHLRWATSVENKADQLIHGTRNRGERNGSAVLTVDEVREIRRLADAGMPHGEIASLFGVSRPNVSMVGLRKRWRWLD